MALANLDEVISIIRRSQNADTAHANLRKRFKLSDLQAQAILDMPLRRLAALERQKIEAEYKEKLQLISYLEDILAHPAKILGLIKGELAELKKKFGDPRRTQIIRGSSSEMVMAAPLPDEGNVIVFESSGQLRREPETQRYLLALGQGDQVPRHLILANARDTLACLTVDGRGFAMAAQAVPHIDSQEKKKLSDLSHLSRADEVAWVLPLPSQDAADEGGPEAQGPAYLLTLTAAGKIKRSSVADVTKALARGETLVMNVDAGDRLMWAALTPGQQELVLVSAQGKGIRFSEDEVRASGLGAGGVLAIKMDDDDRLVGAGLVEEGALLLTVTQQGFGKVSPLKEYPAQKRYGSGIVAARVSGRTGPLVTAAVVRPDDQAILVTAQGTARRVKAAALPAMGRDSAGRALVEVSPRETLTRAVFLVGQPTGQESPEPESAPPAMPARPQTPPPAKGTPPKGVPKKARQPTRKPPAAVAEPPDSELPVSKKAVRGARVAAKAATAKAGPPAGKAPARGDQPLELELPASKKAVRGAKAPPKAAVEKAGPPARKAPARAEQSPELDLPVKKKPARGTKTTAKAATKKASSPPAKGAVRTEEPPELDLPVKRKSASGSRAATKAGAEKAGSPGKKAVVKGEEPPELELPVTRRTPAKTSPQAGKASVRVEEPPELDLPASHRTARPLGSGATTAEKAPPAGKSAVSAGGTGRAGPARQPPQVQRPVPAAPRRRARVCHRGQGGEPPTAGPRRAGNCL